MSEKLGLALIIVFIVFGLVALAFEPVETLPCSSREKSDPCWKEVDNGQKEKPCNRF